MKAHRREAHNCALIECVQVAAEKANWPIRDEYRRMNSLTGGGGERAAIPATATDENGRIGAGRPATGIPSRPPASPITPPPRVPLPAAAQSRAPQPATTQPQATPAQRPAVPPPPVPPPPAKPATPQHGATRFSSVFGTRRR
jgi:hypothetical protein